MIKADGLKISQEMEQLIEREERGGITTDDVMKAMDKKSLNRLSDVVAGNSVRRFDFLHYVICIIILLRCLLVGRETPNFEIDRNNCVVPAISFPMWMKES